MKKEQAQKAQAMILGLVLLGVIIVLFWTGAIFKIIGWIDNMITGGNVIY